LGLKRLSPQDLPPGIRTSATNIADGGRLYTFSHVTLGELGRLRIIPHGPTQIEASAEVAPGDPDAPDWIEKFTLLDQVIQTCLTALPGGQDTTPFPSMEEVRNEHRLYRKFLNAQHSIQMFGLAKSLSEQEYQTVAKVAQGTLATAGPVDRIGIQQRLDELQLYWNDLNERPTI
jgi:hypothetical protein